MTDVGLPDGLNGRQLAITARSIYPDLKVLFVTGYAENAAFDTDRLEPGMAVLIKPFAILNSTLNVRNMFYGGDSQSLAGQYLPWKLSLTDNYSVSSPFPKLGDVRVSFRHRDLLGKPSGEAHICMLYRPPQDGQDV